MHASDMTQSLEEKINEKKKELAELEAYASIQPKLNELANDLTAINGYEVTEISFKLNKGIWIESGKKRKKTNTRSVSNEELASIIVKAIKEEKLKNARQIALSHNLNVTKVGKWLGDDNNLKANSITKRGDSRRNREYI
jgi:hypothetical protein